MLVDLCRRKLPGPIVVDDEIVTIDAPVAPVPEEVAIHIPFGFLDLPPRTLPVTVNVGAPSREVRPRSRLAEPCGAMLLQTSKVSSNAESLIGPSYAHSLAGLFSRLRHVFDAQQIRDAVGQPCPILVAAIKAAPAVSLPVRACISAGRKSRIVFGAGSVPVSTTVTVTLRPVFLPLPSTCSTLTWSQQLNAGAVAIPSTRTGLRRLRPSSLPRPAAYL